MPIQPHGRLAQVRDTRGDDAGVVRNRAPEPPEDRAGSAQSNQDWQCPRFDLAQLLPPRISAEDLPRWWKAEPVGKEGAAGARPRWHLRQRCLQFFGSRAEQFDVLREQRVEASAG